MPQHVDALIADLASRQYGAFTRAQAIGLGVTDAQIRLRLLHGRWIAWEPGVYLIAGTHVSWHTNVMAALLASGSHAAASHLTAAALLGIVDVVPIVIDVLVPWADHDGPRKHRRVRRAVHLGRRDARPLNGILTTTPPRTLVDLAGVLDKRLLAAALDNALVRGLVSIPSLRRYIHDRNLGHKRGVGTLQRLLDDRRRGVPESELERELLNVIAEFGLPEPVRQPYVGPYRVDFAYPDERVLVECDGRATHWTADAFTNDRTRDNALVVDGWRAVLRFTWDHLTKERQYVAATIEALLLQAG